MAVSREPAIVVVLTCVMLLFVVLSIAVFPSPITPSATVSSCPGSVPTATLHQTLSPQDPVLLPKCSGYPVSLGSIAFTVRAPADLHGAWQATNPIAVAIFNATVATMPNYGWPPPIGSLNGSINLTLFPGEYEILFQAYGAWRNTTWIATQTIHAVFDRGLDVLQGPENVPLSEAGYVAWPISSPANASEFFFESWMATTACDYEMVVAPNSVFVNFTSGGPLLTTGTVLLLSAYTNACTVSAEPTLFGPGVLGPLNLTSGDVVVFLNQAGAPASLSLLAPFEISYLLGPAG